MEEVAFGIKRPELMRWKQAVTRGEIAFLTHYWFDPRFPNSNTVTKVGCSDLDKLRAWCVSHRLDPEYIHHHDSFPHFDLIGAEQIRVMQQEGQWEQIRRFDLIKK